MTEPTANQPVTAVPCAHELKQRILAAIAEHMRRHGRHNWDNIRERAEFAPVIGKQAGSAGHRKFFRWVDAASKPTPPDKTRPHEARKAADDAMAIATQRAELAANRNLPAAPTPSYFLRAGADAERNVDLLVLINQTSADIEHLRDYSMSADVNAPGGAVIVNDKTFDASIRRRLELVETVVNLRREIFDLEYYERFYGTIGNIITEELSNFPEVQERVVQRLAELSRSQGMVVQAEIR